MEVVEWWEVRDVISRVVTTRQRYISITCDSVDYIVGRPRAEAIVKELCDLGYRFVREI